MYLSGLLDPSGRQRVKIIKKCHYDHIVIFSLKLSKVKEITPRWLKKVLNIKLQIASEHTFTSSQNPS